MNPSIPDPLAKGIALFAHLDERQMQSIRHISTLKRYAAGEILFYEGEDSRHFHLLIEGEVSVFKSSGRSETVLVHRFRAPSLIAEVATLKQIPYPASAECTRDASILQIDRNGFLALLKDDPSLSIAFISSLMHKISALEKSLQRHSAPNAASKVARLILDDCAIFARLKGIEIANLLGITPETLSRTLKKFREHGLITLQKPKGVKAADPQALAAMADNNFPLR